MSFRDCLRSIGVVLTCMLALSGFLSTASAQLCGVSQWLPGDSIPGVNGVVRAMTSWDPDGAGPATQVIIVGGEFSRVGNLETSCIASYDPATLTWSSLGSGLEYEGFPEFTSARALAVLPNGDLVVAGMFTSAGGTEVSGIARWNGAIWSAIDDPTFGISGINALAVLPSGDLVAAGFFEHFDDQGQSSNVARWDGQQWYGLGSGLSDEFQSSAYVSALHVMPNGDLIAGGFFTFADGNPVSNLARWNGTTWSDIGGGVDGNVLAISNRLNGDLVVGGIFGTAGITPASNIARWTGAAWTTVGTGTNGPVYAIETLSNGDLIVGGGNFFGVGGIAGTNNIARWNGTTWSALNSGIGGLVYALSAISGLQFVAGGSFDSVVNASPMATDNIAIWVGTNWISLPTSLTDTPVNALLEDTDGSIIAGRNFISPSTQLLPNIARWENGQWESLGSGTNGSINALALAPNGDIIAGGFFSNAGGVPALCVARWDGNNWAAMGTGLSSTVRALATLSTGDIIAGGDFVGSGINRIARWDGTQWVAFGSGSNLSIYALLALPNGEFLAGGDFTTIGGTSANRIARWNGTQWLPLGVGVNGRVVALTRLPNGDVIAGGTFGMAGGAPAARVARWDGTAWFPMDTGFNSTVNALTVMPGGDVIAGGFFQLSGANLMFHVARWNGSLWSPVGDIFNPVNALISTSDGDLFAGGTFGRVNISNTQLDTQSAYFAHWVESGSPRVNRDPTDLTIDPDADAEFTAIPVFGFAERTDLLSYRWQRNGVDIMDGPGGASLGGGFVTGASGSLESTTAISLLITDAQLSDAGEYTIILSNDCDETSSAAAALTINSAPPTGCDGDADGNNIVNFSDITAVLAFFTTVYPPGTSPTPGDADGNLIVNFSDITRVLARFATSCE